MNNKNRPVKELFQQVSYYTRQGNEFLGNLLQEIDVRFIGSIPTAGITFNEKMSKFIILINPDFFFALTLEQRSAVLIHELMHFTNGHLFRWKYIVGSEIKEKMQLLNIAADLAINQYINNLPDGCELCRSQPWGFECPNKGTEKCQCRCLDVKDWVYMDGKKKVPFPKFKTMELYYKLLLDPKNQKANKDNLKGKGNQTLDEHDWDNLSEEDKERLMKEAQKVLQRTVEKTSFSHSLVPQSVHDLLQEIETEIKKLDYKGILKRAIKKTVAVSDRESTWYRPNKRFGTYAPGTTVGKLPKLDIFIDSSGSISHTEANTFLDIMDNFLKVGAKECMLGLWHTDLYYFKKYKKNQRFNKDDIQSGGTNADAALTKIKESNSDLAIILTDGYFSGTTIDMKGFEKKIVWIISENGDMNHPNAKLGFTIGLAGIKNK